jgi:hypothetical protein
MTQPETGATPAKLPEKPFDLTEISDWHGSC